MVDEIYCGTFTVEHQSEHVLLTMSSGNQWVSEKIPVNDFVKTSLAHVIKFKEV